MTTVCWLKPSKSGATYLPTVIGSAEECAVFKPAGARTLREYITKNELVKLECSIPGLVGEPLVVWAKDPMKRQPGTVNGLATGLAGVFTAEGVRGVFGLALLVRSTSEDGMPTADVFKEPRHRDDGCCLELLRILTFINDATLMGSGVNLRDAGMRDQLVSLWPAYAVDDTLRGNGTDALMIEKKICGQQAAQITMANLAEYLADPVEWVRSRRPADADERDAHPWGLNAAEAAAFEETKRRHAEGKSGSDGRGWTTA